MLARFESLARELWREHRELARRWIVLLGVIAAVCVGVWQYRTAPTTLRVAVGPPGSERVAFVETLAKIFADARKPIRLKVVLVKDGVEAAKLLESDKVQLALLRSDAATGKANDVRSFAVVSRRAVVFLGRSAPGAEGDALAVDRLAGKKVAVVSDVLGANRLIVERTLAHAGLGAPSISFVDLTPDRVAESVSKNEVEVAALVIDASSPSGRARLSDAARAFGGPVAIGAVPYPEALAALNRDLSLTTLTPGLSGAPYLLPRQKLPTVAITEELVGSGDLAETTGTQLSKALLDSRPRLLAAGTAYMVEQPPLDALRRFMPHAGVATQASDKSTSFFETYSDEIWLAIFALGLVGSSLAGFATWLGLYRPAGPNAFFIEMHKVVDGLVEARTDSEVEELRRELRRLTGSHVQHALRTGTEEITAAHHQQWFELVDTLAIHRKEEIGRTSQPNDGTG